MNLGHTLIILTTLFLIAPSVVRAADGTKASNPALAAVQAADDARVAARDKTCFVSLAGAIAGGLVGSPTLV